MALPDDSLSSTPVTGGTFYTPDDLVHQKTVSYIKGGIALSDVSQGLNVRTWVAKISNKTDIKIYPEDDPTTITYYSSLGTNITSVSLAFDQLMRPVIAFTDNETAKIYFYDGSVGHYTTLPIPGASLPIVHLDDSRDLSLQLGYTDVLLFYTKNGIGLYMRRQRDRFEDEFTLDDTIAVKAIVRAGYQSNFRFAIEVL